MLPPVRHALLALMEALCRTHGSDQPYYGCTPVGRGIALFFAGPSPDLRG